MVPLVGNNAWSQALGPTHFSWMFLDQTPPGLPRVTLPEVWFLYRTNPAISFWDTAKLEERMARFPFVVAFAFTHDETNHYADILLPDATDLESLQLIRIGGSKYIEQFWDCEGFALRQPAIAPRGEARDFTDIATALAMRTGLLEPYHASINKGALGVPLKDFCARAHPALPGREDLGRGCKAASFELTGGTEANGLAWWKEHGLATKPFPRTNWYLFPTLAARGLRFEMPYQERLLRIGTELGRRLHEHGMHWWDKQLAEYQALPAWKDFPGEWEQALVAMGGAPKDYPFWLLTSRSMQYAWGGNVGMQLIKEVADNVAGHSGVILNAGRAKELGINEGDWLEIATPQHSVRARAVLRQGIRPDTLLLLGQFGHWATPVAKDFGMPSMNSLVPMTLALTDATGSAADIVARLAEEGLRDEVGDDRGPAALRRLPDLHRGLQARERHAARRAVAARARHGGRRVPGGEARLRAGGLHALRRPALHACVPEHRDEKARRRHRHHRLRPVHRLRLLRGRLPLPGALQERRGHAAPERGDQVHLLRGAHRRRPRQGPEAGRGPRGDARLRQLLHRAGAALRRRGGCLEQHLRSSSPRTSTSACTRSSARARASTTSGTRRDELRTQGLDPAALGRARGAQLHARRRRARAC